MDQVINTIVALIIRLIAVALLITGLIFAREFLHEKFDPARYLPKQNYPRAMGQIIINQVVVLK
jgi:hypothetical protein